MSWEIEVVQKYIEKREKMKMKDVVCHKGPDGLDYISYLKDHPHGIIRQDRGGVIDYDSILCWSPLDNIKAF